MEHRRNRAIIIGSLAIVLALLVVCVSCCVLDNQSSFTGSSVKNADRYTLDFSVMNQSDSHVLTCKEGDTLHVSFSIAKGTVDLLIGMEGQSPIYRGNAISDGDFGVVVPQSGDYKITVNAKKAAGELEVKLQ